MYVVLYDFINTPGEMNKNYLFNIYEFNIYHLTYSMVYFQGGGEAPKSKHSHSYSSCYRKVKNAYISHFQISLVDWQRQHGGFLGMN